MEAITTKICSKCKVEKSLDAFNKDNNKLDGLQYKCRVCEKEYYNNNREKLLERQKVYTKAHSESYNTKSKQWYKQHKAEKRLYDKQYNIDNKNEIRIKRRNYNRIRAINDVEFRIIKNYRKRLWEMLVGNSKSSHTKEILGCTSKEWKCYLEQHFKNGMTWNNYGNKLGQWSVDHIIPCAIFDISNDVELKQAFHFTNTQPMWHKDNVTKKDNIDNLQLLYISNANFINN